MQVVDEEEAYGETPSELLEMVERSEERKVKPDHVRKPTNSFRDRRRTQEVSITIAVLLFLS